MAHKSQLNFFSTAIKHFPDKFSGKVIDIGALDVNGGPHKLFKANEYVGVDLAAGPNVTLVARGEDIDYSDKSFDVAMSSECFEHNPNFAETIVNMSRMTKDDGLLIFSAAGIGRREHGTPRSDQQFSAPLLTNDRHYYRNLNSRRIRLVVNDDNFPKYFIFRNWRIRDIYFVAIKNPSPNTLNRLDILAKEIEKFIKDENRKLFYDFVKNPFLNLFNLLPIKIIIYLVVIKHKIRFYGKNDHKNFCINCKNAYWKKPSKHSRL